jgi:hypothetical protein
MEELLDAHDDGGNAIAEHYRTAMNLELGFFEQAATTMAVAAAHPMGFRPSGQQLRDVALAAEDTHDLGGLSFRAVDDEVGAHGPEPQRFVRQVLANVAELRHLRQPAHRLTTSFRTRRAAAGSSWAM